MELFRPAIDFHTHFHPPRLFQAIRDWFARESSWRITHPIDEAPLVGTLRRHGVERFVFSTYAHRAGIARGLNDWVHEFADRHEGAIPLGTIHPGDPDYLDEARRTIDELGFAGLKVHCEVQGIAPDDERMLPIYDLVEARGRFVLMHAGTAPWGGNAWTTGVGGVGRLLALRPKLTVVVAHMGQYEAIGFLKLLDRHPTLHLDTTMAFAPACPWHRRIDAALIAAHADRILYGTDWPNIPYEYAGDRDGLLALELPEAAYRRVFYENARRLLGLR